MQETRGPRRGGVFRILAQTDMDSFDPQRANFTFSQELLRCVIRSLMTYPGKPAPEGAVPVPDIAADYPRVSNQGRAYTFSLRPGVRFSPPVNREVRASDFKFAFERVLDPELRAAPAQYFMDIEGAEDIAQGRASTLAGIETPDERTLVIHLRRPVNDFLNILALTAASPLPPEVGRPHKLDYGNYVVATGPYLVESYQPEVSIRLVRNPNWDASTDPVRGGYADELFIRLRVPRKEVLEKLEANEADMAAFTHPEGSDIRRYLNDPNLAGRWHADAAGCLRFIALNCSVAPFNNLKVRQAVNYAIDKRHLREVRGGEIAGRIAHNILPPTIAGHEPFNLYPSPGDGGDVEMARRLLAEGGYPGGFSTWCLVAESSYHPEIGRAIRDSLARVGIDVDLKIIPPQHYFLEHFNKTEAQIPLGASTGWCQDWPGNGARTFIGTLFDGRLLNGPETTNYCRFRDTRVDELIDRAKAAPAEQAVALWAQADRAIMEQAACVPWLHDNHMDLTSVRLRNYFSHPFLVGADWTNVWLDEAT